MVIPLHLLYVSSIAGGRKQECPRLALNQLARCPREHNHLHPLNRIKPVMWLNCELCIRFRLNVAFITRGNSFSKGETDASWVSSLPRPTSPPARVIQAPRRQSVVQAVNGQDDSNRGQADPVKLGSATSPTHLERLRDAESSKCRILRQVGDFLYHEFRTT